MFIFRHIRRNTNINEKMAWRNKNSFFRACIFYFNFNCCKMISRQKSKQHPQNNQSFNQMVTSSKVISPLKTSCAAFTYNDQTFEMFINHFLDRSFPVWVNMRAQLCVCVCLREVNLFQQPIECVRWFIWNRLHQKSVFSTL